MSIPGKSPVLIKPTYDVGSYGHDVTVPLSMLAGSTVTLVPSTSTFVQVLDDSKVPIDEIPLVVTDSDEMEMVHSGDDTDFNKTWVWVPDMEASLYKFTANFAVGMNVSAYTSGNFKISSIQVIVTQTKGTYSEVLINRTIDPGMANMTSVTSQVALINLDTQTAKRVFDKSVTIQIKVNATSGSGTYQCGIIPLYCYFSAHTPKVWTTSAIIMHLHGALSHAFPVFRTEDNENLLDHSGIGI
tara:strand:+ start:94 stop:822 length:729 start_codon:yes stop_codon:yes gene_type:complete